MNKPIRIGTRESALAIWQAEKVCGQLSALGLHSKLVPIASKGDQNTTQPLYEMGVTGIFTKTLDQALLDGKIDLAVHSMKDVPTKLPKGLLQTAVLERGPVWDVLVGKHPFDNSKTNVVATSSLRRQAQWLNRFPKDQIRVLRGNVQTRLNKLETENWDGAIFALAGLERLGITPEDTTVLDWMVPAPAQGAIMIVSHQNNKQFHELIQPLNHSETALCVGIERKFLRHLQGGCTAPIGAYAHMKNNQLIFKGIVCSADGKKCVSVEKATKMPQLENGTQWAKEVLEMGGCEILEMFRKKF